MTAPAAELFCIYPAGSPEWHAARDGVMTGSRIAAVLGLSPWESRFSLWHRMAGLIDDTTVNDEMHWGTLLEPVIRDEFQRRHAVDDWAVTQTGTWRNRSRPWQVVNPDGLVWTHEASDFELFEAKTARTADGWGDSGTDEIPVYYRAQVLWGLDTLVLQRARLAVLIGGSDYREYVIERADDECTLMRRAAREFLDSLPRGDNPGVRPDIDAHSSTYTVVRELHPDIDDSQPFEVPDEIAVPYLAAYDAAKAAAAEHDRTAAVLLDAMGTARRAEHHGSQIAMRIPGRNGNPPYLKHTPVKAKGQKVSAS